MTALRGRARRAVRRERLLPPRFLVSYGAATLTPSRLRRDSHLHRRPHDAVLLSRCTSPEAIDRLATAQLALFGSMGLLYTAGAGVLATRWPDPRPAVFGYHEVWHSMVVVASACYFVLVWSFLGPHH